MKARDKRRRRQARLARRRYAAAWRAYHEHKDGLDQRTVQTLKDVYRDIYDQIRATISADLSKGLEP